MHVLIVSTGYPTYYQPLNGIFYYDQAKALAKEGNKVGFIAIVPTSIKDFLAKGWKNKGTFITEANGVVSMGEIYVQIPKYFSQQFKRTLKSGKEHFKKYIEKYGKPDIIHLHGFEGGELALWIKKEYKIPFIVTEHSSRFLDHSLTSSSLEFAKKIFHEADAKIAVSDSFARKLDEVTGEKFEVVPNITETDFFVPGGEKNKFIFLSAGTFNKNKNQQLQINGFLKISKDFPTAELWLAGDGEEKQKLNDLIIAKGMTEKIKFLGWLNREQLLEKMKQSSCFLISSKHESFGVVAIEAMSCGIPVISTPCGGPESVIKPGINGVITNGSDDDFAFNMLEMLNNSTRYSSEIIRQYAVNNFSGPAISKQLCAVYSRYI